MERICIEHATLVPLDPQQPPVLRDASLVICGGKIASIGAASPPFDRVLDGSGWLVMPGLVNAHTHTPMTLLRGLKDDCPLSQWLAQYIWPAEASLTRDDFYWGAMLGIAELLAAGTTCVSDMYRASGELLRAAAETGIKANICESITAEEPFIPADHAGVQESLHTIRQWNGYDNGRIRCDTSIQSCWQTPPALWRFIGDMAAEHGIGIHVHLAETEAELETCRSRHGDTPVRLLEKAGVFRNRVAAVHGIWLDETDQQILRDHGAVIVHDPASNYKCCCGFANLRPYLEMGIPVALGTDGVCSNNSADLFETMKTTALVQKMLNNDPCLLPARQVLEMATQAGLASQGRTGEAGMLRCGMDADLIALDRTAPALHPDLSPESDLVYAANGAMVRLTMVRGRILYENGRFPTMDIRRVYEEIERIVRRIAPYRR